MPKDLRDIIKEAQQKELNMPENHRQRFEDRLEVLNKPKKRNTFFFLKIAASLLVLVGLGYAVLGNNSQTQLEELPQEEITSLGSISPEMQKVENYYITAINYELASLEQTPENKELLDTYLDKVGKLSKDYKRLTKELSESGLQEKTINALITNLQLQLQLLVQLKDEINDLKMPKNENATI